MAKIGKCSLKYCERTGRLFGGGAYCDSHFRQGKHLGLIGDPQKCPTDGCFNFVAKGGLCLNCYEGQQRQKTSKREYEREFRRQYLQNPERREACRASSRRWYQNNKESEKLRKRAFYTSEKGRKEYAARTAKRRAQKLRATPPWVNEEDLKLVYVGRPPGHHVDHIIPLNHPQVCGLHVPWNLQYLPASENISKGNKLFEEVTRPLKAE